jgi:hypothetical protein
MLAMSTVLCIGALAPGAAAAQNLAYCIKGCNYNTMGECSFDTLAQCRATASGQEAFCVANPYYQGASKSRLADAAAPQGRRHRVH